MGFRTVLGVVVCVAACTQEARFQRELPPPVLPGDPGLPPATGVPSAQAPSVCDRMPDPGLLDRCTEGVAAVLNDASHARVIDAIVNAQFGDTIQVCPGRWLVRNGQLPNGVSLVAIDPSPGVTRLTGEGQGRVLDLTSTTTVLEGLQIEDGTAPGSGAGVFCNRCSLTVRCSAFVGNRGAIGGAGLYVQGGSATIVASEFRDNEAVQTGGALFYSSDGGSLVLRDVQFVGNHAGLTAGAAFVSLELGAAASVVWDGVTFEGNTVEGDGAGLYLVAAGTGELVVNDSSFRNNVATQTAGALAFYSGSQGTEVDVELRDGVFEGNAAGVGGAIHGLGYPFTEQRLTLSNVQVVGNVATSESSGAVEIEEMAGFACVDCDLGAAADDNVPNDVVVDGRARNEVGLVSFSKP